LAELLRGRGSWVGETHLQKAIYLLQEMIGVPTGLTYTLYKHGPFSFELRQELGEMRADEILKLVPSDPPYGPRLIVDDGVEQLRERFPKTIKRYEQQMGFVADWVGDRGVVELERLATAFWVCQQLPDAGDLERAKEINRLKPHVPIEDALAAIEEIHDTEATAPVVSAG
jgi:hypothetical protein